ncbi:TetR family transcriptional regulator [Microlunatus endophyticus]|uniref:TetR family transcriptional regulator n=1 Tax=Microlunatus endophyticus TaxID=1716077 RepID=A0A917W542_9ACTN|nr:TetR/AcrR family transcriptional regulator [Microlunatus endophyticus]GGL69139.1 TetR family transcriptional regulator [Microlunatus endophyticus]
MTEAFEGGLPRAVAISWGMVADPQRGPKRELSHERIVEAAIQLADAEGLGAVTMSKVASALGFTTMALYRYVTSKDDLLDLMADAAAGEVVAGTDQSLTDTRKDNRKAAPVDQDWRTQLRRFAAQLRGVYRDHPWLSDLPVSAALLLTPNNLALADLAMRCMRNLVIADADKLQLLVLITNHVREYSRVERDFASGGMPDPSDGLGELVQELVTDDRFPDLAPFVRSGSYLAASAAIDSDRHDPDGDFSFGLEIILDGIATHAEDPGREVVRPAPGWRDDDQATEALRLDHVRKDPKVRDANAKRREAEAKLRDARRHEREMIRNALERGPK